MIGGAGYWPPRPHRDGWPPGETIIDKDKRNIRD
jgi:hypothetical protein